jgi:hypothetical protein
MSRYASCQPLTLISAMAPASAGEARLIESVAPVRPQSGGLDPLEPAVFLAASW